MKSSATTTRSREGLNGSTFESKSGQMAFPLTWVMTVAQFTFHSRSSHIVRHLTADPSICLYQTISCGPAVNMAASLPLQTSWLVQLLFQGYNVHLLGTVVSWNQSLATGLSGYCIPFLNQHIFSVPENL